MSQTILMPLPATEFDPSEAAIPWYLLSQAGHALRIATPDGKPAAADPRMLTGRGLGPWSWLLRARSDARKAYQGFSASTEFQNPLSWQQAEEQRFDALFLPGGHASGMRPYLESTILQSIVLRMMQAKQPVAAVCHGVVLAARSVDPETGQSVLYERRTTALTSDMELTAWALTCLWLGNYYRTYPQTVEAELRAALKDGEQFQRGPMAIFRDSPERLDRGFFVRDGHYLSGRWPGDLYAMVGEFQKMLAEAKADQTASSDKP